MCPTKTVFPVKIIKRNHQVKIFEVRDRMTFMPMLAVKLFTSTEDERYLLWRLGYGDTPQEQELYVLLFTLQGKPLVGAFDLYDHADRTRQTAHKYIEENWEQLKTGDVVDVEFINGETKNKKVSERLESNV